MKSVLGQIKMLLPFSEIYPYTDLILFTFYVNSFLFSSASMANILSLKAITNSNVESLVSSKAIFCPKSLDRNILTNATVYVKIVNQSKAHINIVKN